MKANRLTFRGQRTDNDEWVIGYYYYGVTTDEPICLGDARNCTVIIKDGLFFHVKPETVGQSTGLTDKNGVEIFEGDFLSFEDDPVDVIMWNVDYSCWITADESAQCRDGYINWDNAHLQKDHTKHYIVQGNIYENPDMLGGKS